MYFFRWSVSAFLTLMIVESVCYGQDDKAWDNTTASKTCNALRVTSRSLLTEVADCMRDAPQETFPGITAFLKDFDRAFAALDESQPASSWPLLNVDTIAVENTNYWKAFYEVRPADPLLMLFHGALYGCNGQASRTYYTEQIAVHTPLKSELGYEMFLLLSSGRELVSVGDAGVLVGVELMKQGQWQRSVEVYNDVVKTIPKQSLALFELAQATLSAPASADKLDRTKLLQESRRQDPFRVQAYQGDFSGTAFRELMALPRSALPAWRTFQNAGNEKPYPGSKLEGLSVSLQSAGLHEMALLTRQILVARRASSYSDADLKFVKKSLASLCPKGDFNDTLNRLRDLVAPFSLTSQERKN